MHKMYNKHKEEFKRGRMKRRGRREAAVIRTERHSRLQTDAGCAGGS